MSLPPPSEALLAEDEDYNSEDDSDFDPTVATATAADADDSSSSSDDDESDGDADNAAPRASKKSQDKPPVKKRKRGYSNDSGGEGGLIKTRSQKAAEQREKAGGVKEGAVTTDVDQLWAQMNAAPIRKPSPPAREEVPEKTSDEGEEAKDVKQEEAKEVLSATGERMVAIKTTYEFAGETITYASCSQKRMAVADL